MKNELLKILKRARKPMSAPRLSVLVSIRMRENKKIQHVDSMMRSLVDEGRVELIDGHLFMYKEEG